MLIKRINKDEHFQSRTKLRYVPSSTHTTEKQEDLYIYNIS